MDPIAATAGLSCMGISLLCIALAIPLVKGWVAPNHLYGVRFPQSFASDDAWFAINKFGGKRLIFWSIPLIALGAAMFFMPLQSHPKFALVAGLAPVLAILAACFESWKFARRYKRPS